MAEDTKKKIIILDDDKFLLNMYAAKFHAAGVEVDAVETGQALIDKLKQGAKPDILVMDIIIPGLSGLDTLEELRKQKLIEGIKVVMLTNQGDQEEIDRAKSLGIDGYIVKATSTPSEVVERVMKVISS